MLYERALFGTLCVLLLAFPAHGQNPADSTQARPARSHALGRGKLEIAAGTGMYAIGFHEWVNDVGEFTYSASFQPMIGANVGVGIASKLALQFGLDIGNYRNDRYWRPEEPHNPYLATARIVSVWSGLRYEFGNPGARLRPYVGGGAVSARFTNIHRGPKDTCSLTGGRCIVIAPELFYETRLTGYFDFGVNLMLHPAWGLRIGLKLYPLRGDETDTAPTVVSPGEPTVHDLFWHNLLCFGVVYRWN